MFVRVFVCVYVLARQFAPMISKFIRSFRPWQGLERMKEVLLKEALVVVERCRGACRGAIRSNMHN